ncbi:MAG: hypothetical protein P8X96_11725 [Desulfobacteraceae bacterium]|jgi:hypothetical protein
METAFHWKKAGPSIGAWTGDGVQYGHRPFAEKTLVKIRLRKKGGEKCRLTHPHLLGILGALDT